MSTILLADDSPHAQRMGERIRVYDPLRDGDFEADIVDPVFFDPEGARLRA